MISEERYVDLHSFRSEMIDILNEVAETDLAFVLQQPDGTKTAVVVGWATYEKMRAAPDA